MLDMHDASLSQSEQQILENVAKFGWHCVAVHGKSDEPDFAYSVGFIDTLGCPEFIVFGQPVKLMHSMLWGVFRQIRDGNSMPDEGQRWSHLIEGHDCISRGVHPGRIDTDHFNSALWYAWHTGRARESVRAWQLFWPGREQPFFPWGRAPSLLPQGKRQGLFPWESGCSQSVRDCQPALYLPRETGLA